MLNYDVDGCLKDVKLNKESGNRGYSLCLTYSGKDKFGNIHEQIISGVPLPLYNNSRTIQSELSIGSITEQYVDVGYGNVLVPRDCKVFDRIVEYATKEMTLEEIEEKLGYKVKIVAAKEK